jgi:hypothetical protein
MYARRDGGHQTDHFDGVADGVTDRRVPDDAVEFPRRDETPPERDGADDTRDGGGGSESQSERPAGGHHVDEFRTRDYRGSPTAEAVEQADELGHLRGLDGDGQPRTDGAADEQAGPENQRRENLEPEHGNQHREWVMSRSPWMNRTPATR